MRSDILSWRHFKGGDVNKPFLTLFNFGPMSKDEFRFIMTNSSENVRRHELSHYQPIMHYLNAIHHSIPYRDRGKAFPESDFIHGERVNFEVFLDRLAKGPMSNQTFQELIKSENTTANFFAHKQNVIPLADSIRMLANKLHELPEYLQHEQDVEDIYSADKVRFDLDKAIAESMKDTLKNRKKRLESSPKYPEKIQTVTTTFKRNPDVIVEVLLRANGVCERCKQQAPFLKRKGNTPYLLEVHHIIRLADGGTDSIDNAQALCPNCHRELHFGSSSNV
ncbi:HNH endonuclease [Vibrio neonatus]|uniref:HNH endonuclease n=1 Tax=Vibrio neonatus TaxID=278860 RepID=UPI0021C2F701|nr:HNH endonuclease signature motif containing protein [Vibrio neonatus]